MTGTRSKHVPTISINNAIISNPNTAFPIPTCRLTVPLFEEVATQVTSP
jgi:hypothetical protein